MESPSTSLSGADESDDAKAKVGRGVLRGVAFLGFSTESSHGARADWPLMEEARGMRRRGIPTVLLQTHFHPKDEVENARRVDQLVARLESGRFKWAICSEMWTAELGRKLLALGMKIVERRSRSMPEAFLSPTLDDLPFAECAGSAPLDEYSGLVEVLGQRSDSAVSNVDLNVGNVCSYQGGLEQNPFFAEIASDPEFAKHRGCAYCFNSIERPESGDREPDPAKRILGEVRKQRAMLPALQTVWMPFAEVLFQGLSAAFDQSVGDPVWRGLTLAMQLRPDVLVTRRRDIESVAAKAERAGTSIKIAVVGFENFSPAEIQKLNRGVTPEHLAEAAEILRGWREDESPGLNVRELTPSFILFTPWTRFEDLELNLAAIARHGLTNANIERLRLGRATPLYEMAKRAGLTSSEPVRLAVHPNGYYSEAGIRFQDPRVASVCEGFDQLKAMSFSEQAPLLAAIVDAVRRTSAPETIDWAAVGATWKRIEALSNGTTRPSLRESGTQAVDPRKVQSLLVAMGRKPSKVLGEPASRPLPTTQRPKETGEALGVAAGRGCNNGCHPCVWERRMGFRTEAHLPITAPIEGRVVQIAGREPTLREDLPDLIRAYRAAGAARVEIDTNGRRFVYPGYARALAVAGLDVASVKLFGSDAATWDAHTRTPGSFAQTLEGMAILAQQAPGVALAGVVLPGREPGTRLDDYLALAKTIGLRRLRVVLRLAHQDLLALAAVEQQVGALVAATEAPVAFFSVD